MSAFYFRYVFFFNKLTPSPSKIFYRIERYVNMKTRKLGCLFSWFLLQFRHELFLNMVVPILGEDGGGGYFCK